jgi:hypothetical protein
MPGLFQNALDFSEDLWWDVSKVINVSDMFRGATFFNGIIITWNTSSLSDMSDMFSGASSFNGEIGTWDTSSVSTTFGMFSDAVSFNQDLSNICPACSMVLHPSTTM